MTILKETWLWGTLTGTCVPSLVKFRLTVQKLLTKLFSIGFAFKVPQNWGFGQFRGQNLEINISCPQKALPFTKTCILTYHLSKSVNHSNLWVFSRNINKTEKNAHRSMQLRHMLGKFGVSQFRRNLGVLLGPMT